MIEETTRPFTDAERAELLRLEKWRANEDLGGPITFLLVFGVCGGALGSCASARVPHATLIGLGVALVLWILAARANLRATLARKARYRVDLAKGEATAVITGQTTNVRTDHMVVMQEPRPPFYRTARFWSGLLLGAAAGFVAGTSH